MNEIISYTRLICIHLMPYSRRLTGAGIALGPANILSWLFISWHIGIKIYFYFYAHGSKCSITTCGKDYPPTSKLSLYHFFVPKHIYPYTCENIQDSLFCYIELLIFLMSAPLFLLTSWNQKVIVVQLCWCFTKCVLNVLSSYIYIYIHIYVYIYMIFRIRLFISI